MFPTLSDSEEKAEEDLNALFKEPYPHQKKKNFTNFSKLPCPQPESLRNTDFYLESKASVFRLRGDRPLAVMHWDVPDDEVKWSYAGPTNWAVYVFAANTE